MSVLCPKTWALCSSAPCRQAAERCFLSGGTEVALVSCGECGAWVEPAVRGADGRCLECQGDDDEQEIRVQRTEERRP